MKNIILVIGIIISTCFISIDTWAQGKANNVETLFTVEGQCGMCKKRIEDAAYIPGVRRAEWSVETQTLKVVYNANKTDKEKIKQAILKVGHDVDGTEANQDAFKKLPKCCNYRDPNLHKH